MDTHKSQNNDVLTETNDTLCLFYGGERIRYSKRQGCPIVQNIDPCYCLTELELQVLCVYMNCLREEHSDKILLNDRWIPTMNADTANALGSKLFICTQPSREVDGLRLVDEKSFSQKTEMEYWAKLLRVSCILDMVFFEPQDPCDRRTAAGRESALLKLLSGLLYTDSYFAKLYFHEVGEKLITEQFDEYIEYTNTIMDNIIEWNQKGAQTIWGRAEIMVQSLRNRSLKQSSIRVALLDELQETGMVLESKDTSQWASQFVHIVQQKRNNELTRKAFVKKMKQLLSS